MEHFIYMWLWDCIKYKIDWSQFGGKKGSSIVHACIQLMHKCFSKTDKLQTTVDIVLIDYAKAFDHLDHNLIIQKIENMGVPKILTKREVSEG